IYIRTKCILMPVYAFLSLFSTLCHGEWKNIFFND
ncbi:hypothetical protein M117_1804, partial [Bacteroides fragilis str. 3774 T13]